MQYFSIELNPRTIVPAAACWVIAGVTFDAIFKGKKPLKSIVISALFDAVWCWATFDRPWVCGVGLIGKKIAVMQFGESAMKDCQHKKGVAEFDKICVVALPVLFLGGLLFNGIRALPRPPWAP